ncbi:hypothetical protein LSH36_124g00017 [Paralvinella palmiformis]|uniref:Rho guanine nucleotide exchange factor n=1 Tax=Paralvinella palmiformis TaxID=53620 RepID=A0AAD9NBB6_9ANNE|nr:hypothetical protein LSH36_124g00017 [Paralvinella palmiformis]
MKTILLYPMAAYTSSEQPAAESSRGTVKIRNPFRRCRRSVGILDDTRRKSSRPRKKRKWSTEDSDGETSRFRGAEQLHLNKKKMRSSSLLRKSSHSYSWSDPGRRVESKYRSFRRSVSFLGVLSCSSPKTDVNLYPRSSSRRSVDTKRTPVSRRLSTYWFETIEPGTMRGMTKTEMDRQEAIYELYRGEKELADDLVMLSSTYRNSMKKLELLCDDDLERLFGYVDALLPVHRCLVESLRSCRRDDGTTDGVGEILVRWVRKLDAYVSYCANQVYAKDLLDERKQNPAVDDFLQRCQQSPFSRKLDLWNFLDVPRGKLVKYPLLFRRIQQLTPIRHDDHFYLEKVIQDVNAIIEDVDREVGRARCQFVKDKLRFSEYEDKCDLLQRSTSLVCDGVLRYGRRTKLNVFLFDQILLLTRKVARGSHVEYRVCHQPIPASDLTSDACDSDVSRTSFRSPFSSSHNNRRSFKIAFQNSRTGHSYTLIADDEHDRRQWLSSIRTVKSQFVC